MGKAVLKKINNIGSAALEAKTGKSWAEWLKLLDAAGAAKMTHAAIAAHLHDKLGCPGWWSQMITVGYEQERGLREKHQKSDGKFTANASKTVAVALTPLFIAWTDAKVRQRWLPGAKFKVSKSTPNRSIRITWTADDTRVEVMFYAKGTGKSQVTVEHNKLADAAAVAASKEYWKAVLERLKELLEN